MTPHLADMLQRAVHYHQGGNLAQAEPLYRQILEADPRHAETHHLLGLLAHQTGHHEAAVSLLRQSLLLNPAADGVHFNLGLVSMSRGQFTEAAAGFRQVLTINPVHVEAYINLGNALLSQNQLPEAASAYSQALRLQPLHADAHLNLGNVYMSQGQFDGASACYRRALEINPRHAHGFNNLGNALGAMGKLEEASLSYRQALRIDPANAMAHFNLGNALKDLGRMEEAADCFRQALRIAPNHAGAHNNLGILLGEQGKMAEAVQCYQESLRLNPTNVDAHNNLGNIYKDQGLVAEAAECYERALAIDPRQGAALWNRSLLRLLRGDFASAWPDYEQRWTQTGMVRRSFREPRWDGAPLTGKTILVYAEQGLGDTIQFLRFLPLLKQRGGTVVFECQPAVIKLLDGVGGVDLLIAAGDALPAFDVQVPLLSLPGLLGTALSNIPSKSPYMTASRERVHYWRQELEHALAGLPAGERSLTIGIAWQGDLKHKGYRNRSLAQRSVPLASFEPLARIEGVRLVSMQVGEASNQIAASPFTVTDLGSHFNRDSLEDVAGALMSLDLVVSVDTAVPHLAGALGVPVWVALPHAACWRWQLGRDDSPWYPTMRLFRQNRFGEWGEVFERIATAIRTIIATKRPIQGD